MASVHSTALSAVEMHADRTFPHQSYLWCSYYLRCYDHDPCITTHRMIMLLTSTISNIMQSNKHAHRGYQQLMIQAILVEAPRQPSQGSSPTPEALPKSRSADMRKAGPVRESEAMDSLF